MTKKNKFLQFLFCLVFTLSINAQNFERFSNKQGFNQNTINAIEQDKYGFLWYATPNGLIRYDGYDFETFTTQSKSDGTISSNNITSLFNDDNGLLWIGTNVGVNVYVPSLERFYTIKLNSRFKIVKIAQDSNGFIWFSGNKHLHRIKVIDIVEGLFDVSENILSPDILSKNLWINTFSIESKSSIILGTNEGLKRLTYHYENKKIEISLTVFKDFKDFYDKTITKIFKDEGNFWIGTSKGLYSSNLETEENFILSKVNISDGKSDISVNCIYKDQDKNLWIGTVANGLLRYNPVLNSFKEFKYNPKNQNGISSHRINAIYQDNFKVIWIGTAQGGINKLDVNQKNFYNFSNNPYNDFSLPDNLITSILEDSTGRIWVSGYNKKLSRTTGKINSSNISSLNFENIENSIATENTDIIRCIYEDDKGYIWLGSDEGIFVYNPKNEKFKKVFSSNNNFQSLSFIRVIEQINDNEILIAGNKIVIVNNPWQNLNSPFPELSIKSITNLQEGNVQAFQKGSNNQLWFGTNKGLYQCSYIDEKIITKERFTENSKEFKITNNNIFSLLKNNDELWIGTFGGGLNKMSLNAFQNVSKIEYFRKYDIIPDDAIYGILKENKDNFWISTDMGLVNFNPKNYTSSIFDVRDGLLQNNFRQKAYYKGKSGYFYFGGLNGLTIFNPKSIKKNNKAPNILITSLKINNKPIKRGASLNDEVVLEKSISETDYISISESEKIISFDVVAEQTSAPAKNKLAYKLEGLNKDWVFINQGKATITYTSLVAKDYKLKIKAANRDGIWSKQNKIINIQITPLWYRTWWSYTIAILLIIAFIIGVMYYFIRHEKLKQKLIYEQIDKDRMEVVNQGKFKYFTNLSHEFRTPLTLISAPLDRIIEGNIDPNNRKLLDIIKRNTHRLLSLVDQLITFRHAEQGYVKLNYTKLTLGEFLHPTTEAFENYALEKNINFFYEIKSPNQEIVIDVEKFERILFNLLSNSFKNTPAQGSISIVVKIKNKDEKNIIKIAIIDTGKGIPKEKLENIFERFFQLGNDEGLVSGGGVGLAFCKSIVDLFNGEIKVKSKVNNGSKFTVYIPSKELSEIDEKEIQNKKSFIKNWVPLKVGEEEVQKEKEQHNSKKHSLLIVENEVDIQNFLEIALSEKYNITIANNGIEALEKIKQKEFSTIVSDIMMPEMDGFELCKRIKSEPETCNLPVLLLTALENETDLIKGLEFGADEYISKPFSLKHLELRIQKLIENNIKIKEYFSKNSIPPKEKKHLSLSKKETQFLEKLAEIVEENLSNSNFGVEELAKEIGLSSSHFYRKLKQLTGQVPNVYIRNYRLQKAAFLFDSNSGFNVAEVMYQIGIESNSYFSTSFKKLHGVSPSEYSKR